MGKHDFRNLLIALSIVIVIFVVILFLPRSKSSEVRTPQDVGSVLAGVTLEVPDVSQAVVLSSGSAQLPPDGTGGSVSLLSPFAQVEDDYFGIIAVNYGGSGVFEYLAMFSKNESGELEQKGLYSLGDRVKVESITPQGSGDKYTVEVVYYDYAPSESYADTPTLKEMVEVQVNGHQIQENNLTPEG